MTEEIIEFAEEIEENIRQGYSKQQIMKKNPAVTEELFSIAKARIKNEKTQKINQNYLFNEEDLRYSTNEKIAEYRAKKLKCGIIIDIGCGIGIQAIAFAKTCKKIIAIEIDERKTEYAKMNAEISGVKNIEFAQADALQQLDKIKKADIIFWDPERPASEEERTLDSLKPSFKELIEKARKITEDISIELPPQIDTSKIKEKCEIEYVSVNHGLNRLNIYFGKLKKSDISAVSLESNDKIESSDAKSDIEKTDYFRKYLYEIDDTIIKAKLLNELAAKLDVKQIDVDNKIYLTSDEEIENSFLIKYRIIKISEQKEIKNVLKDYHFGKAVLRGKIPEKEYWQIRAELEKNLEGKKVAHVFFGKDSAIITEKSD